MNMFCGFLSVINSTEGNFQYAAVLIIIAGIFDAFDGLAARITHSASEFGVELDSLSDLISFGLAPALLLYKIALIEYAELGILIAAFYLVTAALRLARFNVQLVGFEKTHFSGLPSPLGAMTISSFILTFYSDLDFTSYLKNFLILLSILIGVLMISKIKYEAFPKINSQNLRTNFILFFYLFSAILAAIISEGKAIIVFIIIYILFGIFRSFFKYAIDLFREKHT